ncbi:MAG: amidohydrolase family protein [Acidobacteriota bacterium]
MIKRCLISLALLTCGFALAADELPSDDFVILDVRLFDGETSLEKATVVVRDGRIVAVGEALPWAAELPVVKGAGRTLLPGLIDSHTHCWGNALEQALTFGVTTAIDMFTNADWAAGVRRQQSENGNPGKADLYSASVLVTAPGGHGTQYGLGIPTLEAGADVDAFVAARLAEGSDFIKVVHEDGKGWGTETPTLDIDTIRAVAAAAHRRERLAVAHIGTREAALEVMATGVDGLVHLFIDAAPGDDFGRRAAKHGIFVVPTLAVLENFQRKGGETVLQDERLSPYLDGDQRASLARSFGPQRKTDNRFEHALETVRLLRQAQVAVLAGTDAPNPGTAHGASMHRELELLVEAGLTPGEALAAATAVPAESFGLQDRGRIEVGRRADLLLVEGDPLDDITASRDIVAVWKLGVATERRRQDVEKPKHPVVSQKLISDFDAGELSAEFGFGWQPTTDQMAGGASETKLAVITDDARGGVLEIRGEVKTGFPFPWAGAMFFPADQPMAAVDVSANRAVTFMARGDGGTYRLMVFARRLGQIPVQTTFVADDTWERHSVAFESLGIDGSDLLGIAFAGGPGLGEFRFEIDQVELE